MAEAFAITTQTSDELPLARGRGEVKFQVTNRLGRSVRARIGVEPDGEQGARGDWLIVDRVEHALAPGGAVVVTVQVAVPAGTPAGRFPFRLVVTAADQESEQSRSATVGLRHQSTGRSLRAALIIGAVVLAASGYGLYRWLALPACATERAVRDDAGQCACPAGTVESRIADRSICLCAAGTDYDESSETCVPRSCEVEHALYAEAAGACTCPPGTQQAQVDGRARCVCPFGRKYDPGARACAPAPCATPERARYDERTGQCQCPPDTELKARPETGGAVCECPQGKRFDDAAQRCVTLPNLRIIDVTVFPPLFMQRQFALEVTLENTGESPSGAFRLHVVASDAVASFRDQMDVPALGPGQKTAYKSRSLRVEANRPLRIQVRIEPLGFEEGSADDNALEKTFPINPTKIK
ncbi:MAG TPA: hypothetical protein VNM90_24010 [Haliangium sp.]|nr:hypothetical protein [Haliangium sp.]